MASTSAVLNPDDWTQDVVALPPTRTKRRRTCAGSTGALGVVEAEPLHLVQRRRHLDVPSIVWKGAVAGGPGILAGIVELGRNVHGQRQLRQSTCTVRVSPLSTADSWAT